VFMRCELPIASSNEAARMRRASLRWSWAEGRLHFSQAQSKLNALFDSGFRLEEGPPGW